MFRRLEGSIFVQVALYHSLTFLLLVGLHFVGLVPDLLQDSDALADILQTLPDILLYSLSAATFFAAVAVLIMYRQTNQYLSFLQTGRSSFWLYSILASPGIIIGIVIVLWLECFGVPLQVPPIDQGGQTWYRTAQAVLLESDEVVQHWSVKDGEVQYGHCPAEAMDSCQYTRPASYTLPQDSPVLWRLSTLKYASDHLPTNSKLKVLAERIYWYRITLPLWLFALVLCSCSILVLVEPGRSQNRSQYAVATVILIGSYLTQSLCISLVDAGLLSAFLGNLAPSVALVVVGLLVPQLSK